MKMILIKIIKMKGKRSNRRINMYFIRNIVNIFIKEEREIFNKLIKESVKKKILK